MATLQPYDRYAFDAEYLSKLKGRDAATEAHFLSYFTGQLQAKLRRHWYLPEFIDDVRQETFLRVFTAIHSQRGVRNPECLAGFVHSTCNHVQLEFGRARRRYCALDDIPAEPTDQTVNAEEDLLKEESCTGFKETLLALPQEEREILQAVFIEERDREEMCRKLGIKQSNLRLRIHRAKRRYLRLHRRAVNARPRIRLRSARQFVPGSASSN
jgi:RNA polymerase sigma-70 factor (ECF subfamily)